MTQRLCKLCKTRWAVVPDRNKQFSRRKEVCRECHAARLREDLAHVLADHARGEKRR